MVARRDGAPLGIYVALAYCLPMVVWLAAQGVLISDELADPRLSFELLLRALLILQAAAVALSLPWFLRTRSRPAQVAALSMAVLVPLPLYALCWLAGTATAVSLLQSLLMLCGFSALLYALFASAIALVPAGAVRSTTLLGLQVVTLGCLWSFRDPWLTVAGL